MRIEVVAGTGKGPTELAAFDVAEINMGVMNVNLIRLSSFIPPGSEVVAVDKSTITPNWGDKLYCAWAERRASEPGTEAWAGVGWIILDGGKGVFCEHEENSRDAVERKIKSSLMSFMKARGMEPDESLIQQKIVGITCEGQSVCALAMAVYKTEGWSD
ncbi:MAG TPA: pyruvoyl-dependent arginine decarboxylase [Candidatus Saccharimonadales bacterium]|nr:pyruvoyl-dependent arginine decarboxylase [Candidatus Saccharimonadales bacterium]